MKNREKWANELIDILMTSSSFSVDIYGTPHECIGYKCSECIFNKLTYGCNDRRKKWLEQEYSEPVYLSQIEHDTLSALSPIWKYITRDKDGQLSLFRDEPVRMPELYIWRCPLVCSGKKEQLVLFDVFKPNTFSMIKWIDKAPWSIEKLLSLPVKD